MDTPHTGLDHCPRILLSGFRERISGRKGRDFSASGTTTASMIHIKKKGWSPLCFSPPATRGCTTLLPLSTTFCSWFRCQISLLEGHSGHSEMSRGYTKTCFLALCRPKDWVISETLYSLGRLMQYHYKKLRLPISISKSEMHKFKFQCIYKLALSLSLPSSLSAFRHQSPRPHHRRIKCRLSFP